MSLETVQNALKSKLTSGFTDATGGIHIVPQRGATQLFSHQTPLVEIVFAGGAYEPRKGRSGGKREYIFQVFIIQSNWKEVDVTIGGSDALGLDEMLDSIITLLDDYRLTTEISPDGVNSAMINNQIGTQLHPIGEGSNYAASIGMQITYVEHT